jgi:hypothetical protein
MRTTHNDINQWLKFFLNRYYWNLQKGVTTLMVFRNCKSLELKSLEIAIWTHGVVDYLTLSDTEVTKVKNYYKKSVTAYKLWQI